MRYYWSYDVDPYKNLLETDEVSLKPLDQSKWWGFTRSLKK